LVCPGWVKTDITMNALTGDGSKLNKMDRATSVGLPAAKFAALMVEAIENKKEEVYIGGSKEVMGVYLKRFFPKLFSRAVRKMSVR